MRFRFLTRLLIAAAILISAAGAGFGQSDSRPNIIFIFSDDHAYQAISAYGSMVNQTPNIDRLAHEGMLFRNALVTNSLCAPSRAVIQTGKYSHINGVLDNRNIFDNTQQTFPKILRAAGYQTAMFGKWHLKSEPTGFDVWKVLPGQGNYYNPDFRVPGGKERIEGYVTDIIADLAINFLDKKRDRSKPFLLMMQNKAPHRNWMPPPEYLTLYDGVTMWEPPTLFDDYTGRASPARKQEMEIGRNMTIVNDLKVIPLLKTKDEGKKLPGMFARMNEKQMRVWDAAYGRKNKAFLKANLTGRALVRWKYQRYIKDYLRCIASVDKNIGRVLRYLDAEGLAKNTIVIYSSDQGFYLGEHGWFDKRWMYKESLKTPLLVRWPGVVKPGSEDTHLVSNVDYAETMLAMAGAKIPADMQGRSLVPLLRGEVVPDWRKTFYYQYYEGPKRAHHVARQYGVTTAKHKLIYYYEDDEWELFDLDVDPLELHSVYGEPSYERVTKYLKSELARLRSELKVPEKDPTFPNHR